MADINFLLNANARDWTTETGGFTPEDGQIFYYHSHPDYSGIVHVIGDGSTEFDALPIYDGRAAQVDGIRIIPEIKVSDYKISTNTISASGWYTVAETNAGYLTAGRSCRLVVKDIGGGGCLGVDISCNESATQKNTTNTFLRINKKSTNANIEVNQVLSIRLAKSDTVAGAGFKVQAYLAPGSARNFHTFLFDNDSDATVDPGFELVDFSTADLNKTPDGSTASYLVAGSEVTFVDASNQTIAENVSIFRLTDDVASMVLTANVDLALFGFTGFSFTGPTGTGALAKAYKYDGTASFDLSSVTSFSNLAVKGNQAYCQINRVGGFTGWGAGKGFIGYKGSGMKFIMS